MRKSRQKPVPEPISRRTNQEVTKGQLLSIDIARAFVTHLVETERPEHLRSFETAFNWNSITMEITTSDDGSQTVFLKARFVESLLTELSLTISFMKADPNTFSFTANLLWRNTCVNNKVWSRFARRQNDGSMVIIDPVQASVA